MNFTEKISENIAEDISEVMNYDEDKKEIIEYGAFVVIHTIFCTALSLIIAYIFGLFLPAAIIFTVVGLLRIFSGGAHCSSPNRCAAGGTLIFIAIAYLINSIKSFMNIYMSIFYILVCLIFSITAIYKYCPVESENKPIKNEEIKLKLRKKSYIVVSISIVAILITEILPCSRENVRLIELSIVTGLLWQSFTLTPQGNKFIHIIDKVLSIILN